jgi:hypothetical protein
MFEREAGSLGPVFLDRGETLGKGRLSLGASYLFADLTDFDGDNLSEQVEVISVFPAAGTATVAQFRKLDVRTNIVTLFATYGLTDRWDVNALVPLVQTRLNARLVKAGSGPSGQVVTGSASLSESAFGVGDILLRTKYRLLDAPVSVAGGLTLQLPTGQAENFAGLEDTTVEPILILSRAFGRNDVHANVGVEANADDLERSRALYGIGAAIQPFEYLALLVDVFGSSSFVDDDFDVTVQRNPALQISSAFYDGFRDRPDQSVGANLQRSFGFVPRSDIVDLAVGLKTALFGNSTAFVTFIVPLTDDGLRADVIPTAGVQYTF